MSKSTRSSLLLTFVFANVAAGTAGGILQMITPLYALTMKASTAEIGMIRGVAGLGFLLLVIPAGFMIDHYGTKKLFLTGSVGGMFVVLAMAFANTPFILMFLMGLEGFFRSVKLTSLSASFFSSLRSIGLEKAGWFRGAMSIGLTLIGPVIGGYLAMSAQYKLSFGLIILITCIPALLVLTSPDTSPRQQTDGGIWLALGSQLPEFKSLIRQKALYVVLLAEGLGSACFATFNTFIVVLVVKIFNMKPTVASTLLAFEGLLFILVVFFGGTLLKRISHHNIYLLSFVLSIAGSAGIYLGGSQILLSLATAILGLGLGMINLVTSTCIAEMTGDRGKISALYAAARGVGISLGPLLGGMIGEFWGIRMIFISFVPLFILISVATFLLENRTANLKQQSGYA